MRCCGDFVLDCDEVWQEYWAGGGAFRPRVVTILDQLQVSQEESQGMCSRSYALTVMLLWEQHKRVLPVLF